MEIRRELEVAGYRFRSRSDTEVIVNGWLAWATKIFSGCSAGEEPLVALSGRAYRWHIRPGVGGPRSRTGSGRHHSAVLMAWAAGISAKVRMARGVTRALYKSAVEPYLPAELLYRPKIRLSAPSLPVVTE